MDDAWKFPDKHDALIIIDVQNDFLPPKGSLAILGGLEILPVIRELIPKFPIGRRFATQDLHPRDHCSFVENGGLWPEHCVGGTFGSELHHSINGLFGGTFRKGTLSSFDSYSCFYDEKGHPSGVSDALKIVDKIDTLFVCGLATDYCVKATVLDEIKDGFKTYVIVDAIEGVDLNPGDVTAAIEEMKRAGAIFIKAVDIEEYL